jgi:hypothetical protein
MGATAVTGGGAGSGTPKTVGARHRGPAEQRGRDVLLTRPTKGMGPREGPRHDHLPPVK